MNNPPTVTCSRGCHIPYADLMQLIDLTFGFKTPETQFLGLLPKLYKPEYRPQDSNYVVCEDGIPVAAVGAYDHTVTVAGYRIPCRGIGNVAVHPDHRGKGYMKLSMEAAIEDMIRDGVALSTLGGRRQRYQYFAYDRCGPCHTFSITADNLRHTFGTLAAPLAVRRVTDPTDPLLDGIKALSDNGIFTPERAREMFLDIAETWHAALYAVLDGDRFAGYAIVEPNGFITEVRAVGASDFLSILRTLFATLGQGSITLRLPAHEVEYLAAISPIAEGAQTGCSMMYLVLDYALLLEATLALRASYDPLPDGQLSVLVHGRARDERLSITVKDNRPAVTPLADDAPVDKELSHLEALDLFFAPMSPARDRLPAPWRAWFPLPIWMYRADEV